MKTTQIAAASAGTLLAAGIAYAFYFDYKRRHDIEFRKSLEREKKKHRKLQKQAEEAESEQENNRIKHALKQAQEEGYPSDVEEREAFFMEEVAHAETLIQGGPETAFEAAMCFYKALKVYSQPRELIKIYEQTVPKYILDILVNILANDKSVLQGPENVE